MKRETEKKYTYDAFISYRHSELDKFVAENLHKQLEAFRLPGNVSKKAGRQKIERVFRDKDELPLTSNLEDPIMQALRDSEFLIVICSPRLRESLWCKKEIETFIRLHGREKVFAVLIEGEPEDSFPEELLFYEEIVEKPDGTTETVKKQMEPLAADVRGSSKREMLKAMRTELLRLMAPMFSLTYDDLRQRHRERKMRRILTASLTGTIVCFAFGTISTAMVLQIQEQKEQLQAQSAEIRAQSMEISIQNRNLLEYQAVSLAEEALRKLADGDRIGAIGTAVQALTEYNGNEMPYTEEAQYALTEALYIYDSGNSMKPQYQMETVGIINYMSLSEDGKMLLTGDRSGALTIWDIETGTAIDILKNTVFSTDSEMSAVFLGNDRVAYIAADRGIGIYDIGLKQETAVIESNYTLGVYADREGRYLVVRELNRMHIYDGETLTCLYEYKPQEGRSVDSRLLLQGDYLIFQEDLEGDESYWERNHELFFWNLAENTISPPVSVENGNGLNLRMVDGTAYFFLNYHDDDYQSTYTKLYACDPKTASVLWSRRYDEFCADLMLRPYVDGASHLLLAAYDDVKLVNMEDGSEYARFTLSSSVVGGAVYTNLDRYLLFTRSGEYHVILVEEKQDYLMSNVFLCHSQNVMDFEVAEEGYLVLPYLDNRVTVYQYNGGEDREEYDGEVILPETICLEYTEAVVQAREKGLPKAELVQTLFYNEDESLLFACYSDGTIEIYNAAEMELLNSLTNPTISRMTRYLGTDKDGNVFIGGVGDGLMLSPDMKLLAAIESLAGVEQGGSRVLIGGMGESVYTCPVYSLEELLAKAEAYVLR